MTVAAQALAGAVALRSARTGRGIHPVAIDALNWFPREPAVTNFADQVRTRLPV